MPYYVPLPPTWQPPLLPPRPPRRRLWVRLTAGGAAIVLVVVGMVLLLGPSAEHDEPQATTRIVSTERLTYQVPASWRSVPASESPAALGITLEGAAQGPTYRCAGRTVPRSIVGSHFVSKGSGADASTADAATAFVTAFARSLYGVTSVIRTPDPEPVDRGGVRGTIARATVTIMQSPAGAEGSGCRATEATISVLALPSTRGAPGGRGAVILVISNETAGGPSSPPPTPDEVVTLVLASATLPGT